MNHDRGHKADGLYRHAQLARLLSPASIAIVGATPRAGAFGDRLLANLAPYGGRIHLVNPRYQEIGGRPCYPSLAALPEIPDSVVITLPREAVEPVVEEAVRLGAGGAIVFASGYSETGKPERIAQQERLVAMCQAAGMPLVGPNCIGINNYALRARITFMPHAEVPLPRSGAIGMISQSGALGFGMEQAAVRGVSISHLLTCGNSADVDMADYLAYLAEDPACAAIALIFEGMADPGRLLRAAELALARNKPVIACKLAVGAHGAVAAMSHTGSLAGSQAVYRAALLRAGVVLVDDVEAVMETACFFAKVSAPRGRGVAVLATSGGAAIMAADKAELHGVPLPQPEAAAARVLAEHIPEFGSTRNPFDVTAQVINLPNMVPACVGALLDDPNYAALVVPMVFASPSTALRLPLYEELSRQTGKPVITVWVSDWLEGPGAAETEATAHVSLFRSMNRAFAALAAWLARDARGRRSRCLPRLAAPGAAAQARARLAGTAHRILTERESKEVLAEYGIPVVTDRLVHSAAAAAAAAAALGLPVALKVESPDLPHKTEAGVIRLNLRSAAEVEEAYRAVMDNAAKVVPPPVIVGVLVQPMVPQGVEVLIGARVDPLFGPLVVVGLGGVLVELLQDTAIALAPLTAEEAMAMLTGLKATAALQGFRGSPPVDLPRLADIVCRVGEFIADQRDLVAEVDINPLICSGSHIIAVDGLIVKA